MEKPIDQSNGQESVSTKVTDPTSEISNVRSPITKEVESPLNTSSDATKGEGKAKKDTTSYRNTGIIIIVIFIWWYNELRVSDEEVKRFEERGCTPLTWNKYGIPTYWDCPAT